MDFERLLTRVQDRVRLPLWPAVDLVGTVVLVTVAALLVFWTDIQLLQGLIGLPALLFAPGYVFLAVLFPRRDLTHQQTDGTATLSHEETQGGVLHQQIRRKERIALSVGLSVALIPLLGLIVAPIAGSLSPEVTVTALLGFVVLGAILGAIRQNSVLPDERPQFSIKSAITPRKITIGNERRLDHGLFVLLVAGVLATVIAVSLSLVAPLQGEQYTSVTLLTAGSNGELQASNYPTELTVGERENLVLQVENNERSETTYTVIAELQRVTDDGSSITVTETERLLRRQKSIAPGDTWTVEHAVAPSMAGTDLRLKYSVYRGKPPQESRTGSAYRNLHLWVTVTN